MFAARVAPMNPRWAVLVAFYLALGLLGAWYLADTTSIGADLETYRRAGEALWTTGDPYATNPDVPEDYRYRYPPLLAMSPVLAGRHSGSRSWAPRVRLSWATGGRSSRLCPPPCYRRVGAALERQRPAVVVALCDRAAHAGAGAIGLALRHAQLSRVALVCTPPPGVAPPSPGIRRDGVLTLIHCLASTIIDFLSDPSRPRPSRHSRRSSASSLSWVPRPSNRRLWLARTGDRWLRTLSSSSRSAVLLVTCRCCWRHRAPRRRRPTSTDQPRQQPYSGRDQQHGTATPARLSAGRLAATRAAR